MPFEVIIKPAVLKTIEKLPRNSQQKIRAAIDLLSINPRPLKSIKLTDRPEYRIRVGTFRIIYEIHNNELLVIVIKVGHRNNVYDN